jgi:hypothetical protein
MKPIFYDAFDMCDYFNFKIETKADAERASKAWQMYVTDYRGDGCMGCVAEMLTATKNSKKTHISNSGRVDCFIKYRAESGAVVPVSVERKTNGGRIRTFETEFSAAEEMSGRYVVYSMDVCNSSTSNKRRHVDAVVIPRKLFVEKLAEFNAIKKVNRNGALEGFAIQVSSKKLYDWLVDWPIVYDRNAVYCDDDFDGLE